MCLPPPPPCADLNQSVEGKEDEEEKEEDDKANRTARVPPTSQWRDSPAESPNTPSGDRRM